MIGVASRLGALLAIFTMFEIAVADPALAHTGEDASNSHVFVEFGLWGLGVAAALALLVLIFWIRARLRERRDA